MPDEITLPPHLVCFGQALEPALEKLDAALAVTPTKVIPIGGTVEMLRRGMSNLADNAKRLELQFSVLMRDVVEREDASVAQVYRAIGRFENVLDDIDGQFRTINRYTAYGDDEEARALLAATYRHYIQEIRGWLQELVDTLAEPIAALQRKGLPTTGSVVIPLTLTLTEAPQLQALHHWIDRHANDEPAIWAGDSRRDAIPSVKMGWMTKLGLIALGWWAAGALFGNDDD